MVHMVALPVDASLVAVNPPWSSGSSVVPLSASNIAMWATPVPTLVERRVTPSGGVIVVVSGPFSAQYDTTMTFVPEWETTGVVCEDPTVVSGSASHA